MTLGNPIAVLNRLFAVLATVLALLSAPIDADILDTDPVHDVTVTEQAVAKSISCHGATFCSLVLSQFDGDGVLQLAYKDASKSSFENVFRANRADEFDTPPPRPEFL